MKINTDQDRSRTGVSWNSGSSALLGRRRSDWYWHKEQHSSPVGVWSSQHLWIQNAVKVCLTESTAASTLNISLAVLFYFFSEQPVRRVGSLPLLALRAVRSVSSLSINLRSSNSVAARWLQRTTDVPEAWRAQQLSKVFPLRAWRVAGCPRLTDPWSQFSEKNLVWTNCKCFSPRRGTVSPVH